ncbi:hypothetical protein KSP40_PGU014764 [Platanthera guangdongensis]|uniref:1-(5-phosphoribosyl)-5-[(5-phosphoribosylamino)methylideneamino] imidazole-4-carboxamide isomerase HISN3, chloroplastic n=1 Tax=Platanthera guangdongensis TaxID=2320717 RepID=A0ABR2LGE5_9ASPA
MYMNLASVQQSRLWVVSPVFTKNKSFGISCSVQCAVRFRPCIDIHKEPSTSVLDPARRAQTDADRRLTDDVARPRGKVKQIVGSTLQDAADKSTLITNFESDQSPSEFSELYKQDSLTGGHVIMLGTDDASKSSATEALHAYPGGMQVGGGINSENALQYIKEGASHVIVTSHVFSDGRVDLERLKHLVHMVGKRRIVLDLSCRRKDGKYVIVTDRWQKFSNLIMDEENLVFLAIHADEFLVHGVDVEGKRLGIDEELVTLLGRFSPIPVTYAGGVTTMADLEKIKTAGMERVDVTVGSALDIFGGDLAYKDVVAWHHDQVKG